MAMDKNVGGINEVAQSLIDEFKSLARDMNATGEDMSDELMKGITAGIKKHSKEAKSEIAKIFEDFNRITNNFKSRKTIGNSEWTRVLEMSKELLKSERYADAVQEKLNGIAVTFKGIGKVSGLTKVLKELEKAGDKLESVQWSEAGKNYRKKSTVKKTKTSSNPVTADPSPVVEAEKTKQKEVVKTTEEIKKQTEAQQKLTAAQKEASAVATQTGSKKKSVDAATNATNKQSDAIEKATKKMLNMESVVKRYNKLMNSIGREHLTIGEKLSEDTDGWNLRDMVSEAQFQHDYFYSQENRPYDSDELKEWLSEKKKLERFINTYKDHVSNLKTTVNHSSDWDNTPKIEKQIDALRKQEIAVENASNAQKELNNAEEAASSSSQATSIDQKIAKLEEQAKVEEKVADAIQRTAEEQKKLDELNKVADNQKNWLQYLDESLDKSKFETSGKREATEKLRYATNYLVSQRRDNYENAYGEYAKEMAEVAWMHAYQEAERQGVAQSTLTRYSTDAKYNYEANLKVLQQQRDYREQTLIDTQKEIDLINKKTEAQKEFNQEKKNENILYHAGDLSNPSQTQKTYPLGHVRPSKSYGVFNGFTGLYTTEDVDGFWGNEWHGAPISTIDASQYKLFDARTDELATKAKDFFDQLNGTIYGYIEDFATGEIEKTTDVKSIDELWVNFQEVFKNTNMTFEQFSEFVKKAQSLVHGKSFDYKEGLPALDEAVVKTGDASSIQGVSKEVFNADSFQTQLLKMLGFEGIDLRGTRYNGTYTGGTVLFEVKPESIKTVNENWSDVMGSHGYEIDEADLAREEKRRQLAFDTAKAYSQQADAVKEVTDAQKQLDSSGEAAVSGELKDAFDVIQKGERITGKFVTTATTIQEALQKMRQALPEEQKGWSSYIDNIANREDDRIVGAFKSITGSMGDYSEYYKIDSLDDGRVAITFAGIRGEIEQTTEAAENNNKTLIDNENKYQQELEETAKIQQERKSQADVYAEAASNLLSAGYETVSAEDQARLFSDFGNKIYTDGISASEAMDQLYMSLEALRQQSENMPDNIIGDFGSDNEKITEAVSQLQKLSSVDLTRIFDNVDLRAFLESFNIDKSHFATFRTLFEELMQITKAMGDGVDVGNAFDIKMEEITSTIMRLGGHMGDVEDGYSSMMQDFYKHMSGTKVQFNDTIKADYTKDQWKSLYGTYKNRLTSDVTKGIPSDSLYHELSSLWPSLFPEGVLNQQDQFKLIFEKLDEARQLQANNWKTLQGFASGDRDGIQGSVDDIYSEMSKALYANESADAINAEADAAKNVEQNMNNAASAKGKFASANKQVGDSAESSADGLNDEADAMEKVATSAEDLPDGDVVTKLFIGDNEDPSGAIVKQVRMIGDKMQTEAKKFAANEDGGWDVASTTTTEKKLRGMQEYVSAYSKEAKKLRGIKANIRALGEGGMSADLSVEVKKYTDALEAMDRAMRAVQNNPDNIVASQQFDDAARNAEIARGAIEGIFKESQKLQKLGTPIAVDKEDYSKVENLKTAMIEFANSAFNGEAKITGYNEKSKEMYATLTDSTGAVKNITVALDKASGHLQAFSTGTSRATNEWNDFKKQAADGVKRMAGMYLGFNDMIRYGRQGLEYVKEIDLAMTELKKVTDETDASYKEFLKDAGSTSAVIGSTISDFTEATATFARLGYSMEESSSMAETAIIYKNVADGLDSVEESSESIISTMMAFGIEANDTMSIIDRFNAVGNNFAITSAGIGEALQRSASALYSAGNTIDESVALVTAANSVIQNPEQVGKMLADYKVA